MCEPYRATRPNAAQLETLPAVAADGTGAPAPDAKWAQSRVELRDGARK